jgi:hypothetical protein
MVTLLRQWGGCIEGDDEGRGVVVVGVDTSNDIALGSNQFGPQVRQVCRERVTELTEDF